METTEKFARICSATNEGMNEGYLFEESLMYFIDEEDAERYAIELGYADLGEAYDDDAYCYTEWDAEDEREWYEKYDGVWYECNSNEKTPIQHG
jgi:hypothetical protein